jgi:predicted dienelactone hydrolase
MNRLCRMLAFALAVSAMARAAPAADINESRPQAPFAVGATTRAFVDEERRNWQGTGPRPVTTLVWYPTRQASKSEAAVEPETRLVSKRVVPEAALSADAPKHPLLLLSHGASSEAGGLLWFVHYFATRGYIVAAVNHHGDTLAESARTLPGRLHFWERPRDLSVALDQLLVDSKLGAHIDSTARACAACCYAARPYAR